MRLFEVADKRRRVQVNKRDRGGRFMKSDIVLTTDIRPGIVLWSNPPRLVLGSGERVTGLPVSQSIMRNLSHRDDGLYDYGRDGRGADFVVTKPKGDDDAAEEKVQLVSERNRNDRRALVKLDFTLQPGPPDKIQLTSNCYNERIVHERGTDRITRVFEDFPPAGIRPLLTGYHEVQRVEHGEPVTEDILVLLLEMLPGASFRIIRDASIEEREVVIAWTGDRLRHIVPRKYLKQE